MNCGNKLSVQVSATTAIMPRLEYLLVAGRRESTSSIQTLVYRLSGRLHTFFSQMMSHPPECYRIPMGRHYLPETYSTVWFWRYL